MDLLTIFSIDVLKVLVWIIPIVIGAVMYLVHRNWYWPLFETILLFLATNLGLVIYIVTRPTDPRWSTGQIPALSPPELLGGPIVAGVTDPLNEFFGTVTGNINDLYAVKNALLVTSEFLVMSGWALLALIPAFIIAQLFARRQTQRDLNKLKKQFNDRMRVVENALNIKSPK